MKILLTGSSGLLGHEVMHCLVDAGHEIYALVSRAAVSNNHKINFLVIDLSEQWSVNSLPSEMDVIFHLAQSNHFREFPEKSLDIFSVNTYSTLKMLEYARTTGVKHFIYASTGGVYGFGDEPFKESDSPRNLDERNFYVASKLAAEKLINCYTQFFNTSIMRYFFIYGPRQNRSMLVPRMIDSVLEGRPIMLSDTDGIRINPVHVEEAAEATIQAMYKEESATYNIAGPDILSLREIVTLIGQEFGKLPVFGASPAGANHLVADINKMKSLLFIPERKLADHIKELV